MTDVYCLTAFRRIQVLASSGTTLHPTPEKVQQSIVQIANQAIAHLHAQPAGVNDRLLAALETANSILARTAHDRAYDDAKRTIRDAITAAGGLVMPLPLPEQRATVRA